MRRACEDSRADSGWQSPMIRVEALLTENDLAEQFLAALRHRYLAEKFFYWFPLSVRAWLSLCQSAAPYKNFSRSYELIRKHAAEMARRCEIRGRRQRIAPWIRARHCSKSPSRQRPQADLRRRA